jgi:hypothetical protein
VSWPASSSKIALLLLCLAPSAWLAWNFRDLPHLGWYHDDTLYWIGGQSIAQGSGYRILSLPNQPYQTKYPPLYPLLLAGVWKLAPSFPDNLRPALLLGWLLLPLYVITARRTLRDLGLGPQSSWGLASALALSPVIVVLSVSLMSELLFCVLLFSALTCLQRAQATRQILLAGLLAGLAYLTRAAALPLLAAGPLWLLLRRRPRHAALFFAAMAPAVIAWTLWVKAHLQPSTDLVTLYYTNYFGYQLQNVSWSDLPMLVSKNLAFLLASITQLLTSQVGDFYWRLFALAALAGTVRLARISGPGPYHLYAICLLPVVVVCAWPPEARSFVPLFPLLAAGLWCELSHLVGMLGAAWRRRSRAPAIVMGGALAASALVVLFYLGVTLFRFLPETLTERRELRAAERQAYGWIAQQLPPQARFLAYDDTILYLYTGRPAISVRVPTKLYYQDDGEALIRLHSQLDEFTGARGVNYVLATAEDYYRGEVPATFRAQARQAAGEVYRSRRVYQGGPVSIYDLTGSINTPVAVRAASIRQAQ